MSGLPTLVGHDSVRHWLASAAVAGKLPGSLLLHGPAGIGKQRLALWLGQVLLCEQPNSSGPCDQCRNCRLAVQLEHPDLHWFFPLPRPKSAGADRLSEALEDSRASELADRRGQPYRPVLPGELTGIYLAQVQTLRRLAIARPAMGSRKVFVVGDAEALVPQEASTEAANALLKVLEEPPPDTVFILTASDQDELLPTIRSRLLPVRVRPLPLPMIRETLQAAVKATPQQVELAARLSEGSIGRALAFLPVDGEPGPLEAIRLQARQLLRAAVAEKQHEIYAAALGTSVAGARGAFTDVLDFLALWVRDLAAIADGAEELAVNADAVEALRRLAARLPAGAAGAPDALRAIDEARGLTRNNVNPQLILAWLLRTVGSALTRPVPAGI